MQKCKFFKLLAIIPAIAVSGAATAGAQEAVRIGTSSVGSVFYTIAIGAAEVIQKHGGLNATAEPVGGSSANMRGLAAKNIEFALGNSFAAFTAYSGTHNFKKPIELRLVVQGQPSFRWMLLRKGAGIEKAEDLSGRTIVAKRRALPEIELVMKAYEKVLGLKNVKVVETTNSPQAYNASRAGSVDAALMPFSRNAAAVAKPMTDGVLDFLYLPKATRDAMLKHLPPMMWAATFEKGTYKEQTNDVHLIGLNTYFLTSSEVKEETVYKVARAIFENTKEFATYHRAAAQWTMKRSLENVALPFHPGAIRYFKEKGAWTDALEAKQKELLKR